jgi:peptidoglycan/LPS O-acetylase OafA/YrhL
MARSDVRPSTVVPSIEPAAAIGNSEVRASGPHVSGLDGIRAVAVIGVLAFHAGVSGFGGGLLGVDIFFVLSGFLITSLLLGEWSKTGTVSFRRFYERRARRLLPGLLLLVLLVAAYAQWFAETDTLSTLRGDALSTILYVANWRFIFSGQSYFVHFGPPSPLLHTWSLAVEEQFYLVWPAVALFVMRRRGKRGLAAAATILMVASAALTFVLLHQGVSVSRLYYGTDTRTQELMAGALLAVVAPAITRNARAWRWPVTVLGGLGALFLLWALHGVSGQGNFLYEGGFLLVAVASAAVVLVVVVVPRALMARFLGWGVLGYVGRISYGLYLYHYPIFLMIDSQHSGLSGSALLVVRLGVTLAAAVVSYYGIEMPVRRRKVLRGRRLVAALPISVAIAVTAIVLATLPAPAPAAPPASVHTGLFTLPRTPPADLVDGKDVRTLLLGDSVALTLGGGLRIDADRWGVSLDNQGKIGCDLDPDSTVNIEGSITQAAQGCANWPQTWQRLIDRLNPDVVAVELGRWEVSDRIIDGKWTEIGQPAWDRVYSAELAEAIRILSSKGAHVVIFTLPYITQTTEAPNGTPWDINQPVRTNEYNALVRRVVARFPGRASVIDLNRLLDPAGKYTSYLDGVRVRNPDDEHIALLGGMLLRPLILPTLVRLGLAHESSRLHR